MLLLKIHINEDPLYKETEITINCSRLSPDIERLISMLRVLDLKLTGKKDGQTFILDASKVLYIDTADKKTFFYTQNDVYETSLRLYELEEQLEAMDFLSAPDELCRKYNEGNTITILAKDGQTVRLSNSPEQAERIAGFFLRDNVAAIHSSEPNLENVFIKLTGKELDR